ncbi:hypothetical protein NM688_g4564 [Phlebia brevispora]|uniref:Uncharacterized protein n=1 Tax=Phlebia brevispora TaxID=194682 RepID=A0ACC1T2S0_9APHY|nr:hypothetical protein NM688_g4564 [Phlebia brevispora]
MQGYSYITTINTNTTPSRLVFLYTAPDPMVDFFSVLISQSGEKLSILGIEPQAAHSLGDSLRAMFPHKIASDRAREDGIYVIELRKGIGSSEVDRTVFHAYMLRFFGAIGYKLDGSIPMGKAGPLGFGARKELWVFRGSRQRPPSAAASTR